MSAEDVRLVREALPPKGETYSSMPGYMRRSQEKDNAAHAALARLQATLAEVERERDKYADALLEALARLAARLAEVERERDKYADFFESAARELEAAEARVKELTRTTAADWGDAPELAHYGEGGISRSLVPRCDDGAGDYSPSRRPRHIRASSRGGGVSAEDFALVREALTLARTLAGSREFVALTEPEDALARLEARLAELEEWQAERRLFSTSTEHRAEAAEARVVELQELVDEVPVLLTDEEQDWSDWLDRRRALAATEGKVEIEDERERATRLNGELRRIFRQRMREWREHEGEEYGYQEAEVEEFLLEAERAATDEAEGEA